MSDAPPPGEHECRNCGDELTGMYCSTCGQRVPRIPVRTGELLKDVWDRFADVDRGFLRTFVGMFVEPGRTAREYLDGKRASHCPPFRYFLILMAIWFVVPSVIGLDMVEHTARKMGEATDRMRATPMLAGVAETVMQKAEVAFQRAFEFRRWTQLTMPPIIAVSCWAVFRSARRTYAEWMAFALYTNAQLLIVGMLGFVFMRLDLDGPQMVIGLVIYPYTGWALVDFTQEDTPIVVMKSVGVFAVQLVLTLLVTCGVIGLALLL